MPIDLPQERSKPVKDFAKINTMIYGLPGTGKTTFAASMKATDGKDVIFAATEKGYDQLEVFAVDVPTWDAFVELLKALHNNDARSRFSAVVIDTVELLLSHLETHICRREGVSRISDIPFGGGYKAIKNEWLRAMHGINHMGYAIILISHAKMFKVEKTTEEFTMIGPYLSESQREWVVGFVGCCFHLFVDEKGDRVIRTQPTKYIVAKDRTDKLRELMPPVFEEFQKAVKGEGE